MAKTRFNNAAQDSPAEPEAGAKADPVFETDNPGGSPHKADVLCHPALLAIELKDAASPISYAGSDPDPQRAQLSRTRAGAGPS